MRQYHVAQVNIGRILAPLEDPQMAGFVSRLDELNALADSAPEFVWRLQTTEGNATYFRPAFSREAFRWRRTIRSHFSVLPWIHVALEG